MNLPNKLTLMRIIMIPLFVVLFFVESIPYSYSWALLVFALASITDMLDGMIARKRGLVTDFGKLMDPLADKLLVMAAMVCFVESKMVRAWVVVIILGREFLVTSIRLVAAGKGTVIAADRWGKVKTVTQMLWICLGLLHLGLNQIGLHQVGGIEGLTPDAVPAAIIWSARAYQPYLLFLLLALFFTVLSGVNYVVNNRELFADA